jgi:hypothetical protein
MNKARDIIAALVFYVLNILMLPIFSPLDARRAFRRAHKAHCLPVGPNIILASGKTKRATG